MTREGYLNLVCLIVHIQRTCLIAIVQVVKILQGHLLYLVCYVLFKVYY